MTETSSTTCPLWGVPAEVVVRDDAKEIVIRREGLGKYAHASALSEEFSDSVMAAGLKELLRSWIEREWAKGVQCPCITEEIFDDKCEYYDMEYHKKSASFS